MIRVLGLALLLLLGARASAQSLIDDPAVWGAASTGVITWAPSESREYFGQDELASAFSVILASSPWIVKGGLQISDHLDFNIDFGNFNLDGGRSTAGADPVPTYEPFEPITFRSAYALGGPFATSRWFMAGVAVGPALTWGARERDVYRPCGEEEFCTVRRNTERDDNLNPGPPAAYRASSGSADVCGSVARR